MNKKAYERQLQGVVERWAQNEGLRIAKIRVHVTDEIRVRLKIRRDRMKKFKSSDRQLDEHDWKIILNLPWTAAQRMIMLAVRADLNHCIPNEICQSTKYCSDTYTRHNVVFRQHDADYRFSYIGGDSNTGPFRLYARAADD